MTDGIGSYAETGRRRLILCCDGTWNSADAGGSATNVVRLTRVLKAQSAEGIPQIVYYHDGVGTGNLLDKISGGAGGIGISRNIRRIYSFIVNNYATPPDGQPPTDELFLFGFSRGAYTARAVAALIGTIGILHPTYMGGFMEAWNWYRLPESQRDPTELDRRFPRRLKNVPIRCVGVWDTVGSLGVPPNSLLPNWHPCASAYEFVDTTLGTHVEYAFHGLAIDEKRKPFEPAIWNNLKPPAVYQTVHQVWFSGVHSDVGGGYPNHGAADIPFLWMCGLLAENKLLDFNEDAIRDEVDTRVAFNRDTLHNSFKGLMAFAGTYHRKVGAGAGQHVHRSVLDRVAAGGYAINPEFALDRLPVWEPTAFEQKFVWQQADFRPTGTPLTQTPISFCDRVVKMLGGG